jgi:hypothetical protein
MNDDLKHRIQSFLMEQKTGVFEHKEGEEIEYIDFDNVANLALFLDTAVMLLEETLENK